jgi:hypothetical protein
MQKLAADAPGAASPIAMDAMADALNPAQSFDVDVQEIAAVTRR